MFQDASQILGKLGLKPTDSRVYMTLVSCRDGLFIAELCQKTKIKRSTVYLSLKRLMDGGYISQVKVGQRWKYFAEHPERLLAKQETILEDLREVVPFLSKLKSSDTQTEIKFYEGIDGIRKAYETVLITLKFAQSEAEGDAKNLLAFASGQDTQKVFPDWQKNFIDKRKRLDVHYKVVAPLSSQNVSAFTNDPAQLREARYIPDDQFPFKVMMEIYSDSVFIYAPAPPVGGVIIRNGPIAESLRALHQFVWSVTPH